VEHWRRRKFKTAGVLFWQLNDSWPVSSWSVVDSALRPKASYYFAKKFYAPLLVSFQDTGNGIAVWVTNDLMTGVSGKVVTSLRSFRGRTLWTKRLDVNITADISKQIYRVEESVWSACDRSSHYLHTQLVIDGVLASENRFFFEEPKHMQLPRPRVTKKLRMDRDSSYTLTIHSNAFVKNLRLEMEGEDVVFDDNYFDIDAGGSRDIQFQTGLTMTQVKRKLRLRWL
jgi:beta-mannosidase